MSMSLGYCSCLLKEIPVYYLLEVQEGVLGVGSILSAILPSCQYMKNNRILLHKDEYSCAGKNRNT